MLSRFTASHTGQPSHYHPLFQTFPNCLFQQKPGPQGDIVYPASISSCGHFPWTWKGVSVLLAPPPSADFRPFSPPLNSEPHCNCHLLTPSHSSSFSKGTLVHCYSFTLVLILSNFSTLVVEHSIPWATPLARALDLNHYHCLQSCTPHNLRYVHPTLYSLVPWTKDLSTPLTFTISDSSFSASLLFLTFLMVSLPSLTGWNPIVVLVIHPLLSHPSLTCSYMFGNP